MRRISQVAVLSLLGLVAPHYHSKADAVYPAVSFDEVTQTADLIFTGRVILLENIREGNAVFTEVTFEGVKTIYASKRSRQAHSPIVKIRYAGGDLGHQTLSISGTPELLVDHTYLMCIHDDGKKYMNPIVAGPQGYLEILSDPASSRQYVVNPGGKAAIGFENGGLRFSPARLGAVVAGTARYEARLDEHYQPTAPVSATGEVAVRSNLNPAGGKAAPLTLDDVTSYILQQALSKPLEFKRLNLNDDRAGKFISIVDGKEVERPLGLPDPDLVNLSAPLPGKASIGVPGNQPLPKLLGQALSACGSHNVSLTMEQVPTGWSEWQMNNDCMALHNQFMNIFTTTASDNTYGNNAQNEFGGYATSSQLSSIYGTYNWGSSIAVCFTYRVSGTACSRITQSDVFWNPAITFSDDPAVWYKNSSRVNIRATTIHEIGHAWGYQTGAAEQYDYDFPSIMHLTYSDIYETGRGMHARDASIYRQLYDDQVSVRTVRDVGAEGYYAENGLKKSTISSLTIPRGQALTFNKVTIENMSNATVNNVKVKFYLATARDFSGTEYQVGAAQDWTFSSMAAEAVSVFDYGSNIVPTTVPPGTYYVLVDAAINGAGDDYNDNNTGLFSDQVTVTAPTISRSPATITSNVNAGSNTSAKTLNIQNVGGGTLDYSLSVSYSGSSTGWLSLSPTSGSSTGEVDVITLNHSVASLPPGTHTATINITSSNATNSPQTATVQVNVAAVPVLTRSPSSFTRNTNEGQSVSADNFTVRNSGNTAALAYTISDDVSWLSVSPGSGSSSGADQTHSINYDISNLSQGSYSGTITISAPSASNPTASILVFMNVGPSLAPANNNLASAAQLNGLAGITNGTNTNATKETNEANHGGNTGGRSVWWSWTAPASGTAVIDTIGSGFDTTLAVYTGNNYPLTLVVQDDDSAGNNRSRVSYNANLNATYKIAVDGYNNGGGAASGTIVLNRVLTPVTSEVGSWSLY